MKVNTTDVIRLYKQQYVLSTNPGGLIDYATSDPAGASCPTLGGYIIWNGNYYQCQQTEINEMKNASNALMHRRTTIVFNANGGTGGSTQVRTWNVENVTQPSNPTRTGYTFLGWATTSGATSPNVTLPMICPSADVTYYAVWQINQQKTVSPSITDVSTITFRYTVKNNDGQSATIYAEHDVSDPDVSRGVIAAGASTGTINTGISTMSGNSVTIYAKAQADGELMSDIVSVFWSR
jgi:uncharacterized repeat protein (TIGR02543 family)